MDSQPANAAYAPGREDCATVCLFGLIINSQYKITVRTRKFHQQFEDNSGHRRKECSDISCFNAKSAAGKAAAKEVTAYDPYATSKTSANL